MGITSGGSQISIIPTVKKITVDGSGVAAKGLIKKIGEKAEMIISFASFSDELIKTALLAKTAENENGCKVIIPKSEINEGDYFDNISFVGKTLEGKNIIVIMNNAICTSGFSFNTNSSDNNCFKLKFECCADNDEDCDCLPYKIYYPQEI